MQKFPSPFRDNLSLYRDDEGGWWITQIFKYSKYEPEEAQYFIESMKKDGILTDVWGKWLTTYVLDVENSAVVKETDFVIFVCPLKELKSVKH